MGCKVDLPVHCRIHFRFLVDGNLKCDPSLCVVRGSDGGFVNEMWIRPGHLESFYEQQNERQPRFSQQIPDRCNYEVWTRNHEPPDAPPHMFTQPDDHSFSSSLINHVYCAEFFKHEFDDEVMVLSMCQKLVNKRIFTVYYKPSPHKPAPLRVSSNV